MFHSNGVSTMVGNWWCGIGNTYCKWRQSFYDGFPRELDSKVLFPSCPSPRLRWKGEQFFLTTGNTVCANTVFQMSSSPHLRLVNFSKYLCDRPDFNHDLFHWGEMSLQLTAAVLENCWHFRLYLLYLKLRTSDKLEISAVIKLNPYSCWKTLLRVYSYT